MQSSSSRRSAFPIGGQHPTLDESQCALIGQQLEQYRVKRGLSVNEVSRALLLSTRQVRALETVDASGFYNTSFFLAGLKKYATLAGLDPQAAVDAVTVAPRDTEPEAADYARVPEQTSVLIQRWGGLAAVVVACVGLLVWGALRLWDLSPAATIATAVPASSALTDDILRPQVQSPSPVSPAEAPTNAPAEVPVVTEPVQSQSAEDLATSLPQVEPALDTSALASPEAPRAAVATTGHDSYGLLWLPERAWMFLRLEDNTVIERTVTAGETVALHSKPRYLALGSGEAELTIGYRSVDISQFVRNGTLRMGVAEFTSAESSAPDASGPDSVQSDPR